MIFSELRSRADLARHAEEPLHQVKLMGTLVQENAAALSAPARTPVAGIIIALRPEPVGDDPVHAHDLSELAGINHLLDLLMRGNRSLIEHCGLFELRILLRLRDHALRLRLVDGNRFFHDDMLALPHCKNRKIGM